MEEVKVEESWMKSYWRPSMGWLYMLICLFDFILFPLISMIEPVAFGTKYHVWEAISLQGGGLIHLSFGAILGITAWGRTAEKSERVRRTKKDDQ